MCSQIFTAASWLMFVVWNADITPVGFEEPDGLLPSRRTCQCPRRRNNLSAAPPASRQSSQTTQPPQPPATRTVQTNRPLGFYVRTLYSEPYILPVWRSGTGLRAAPGDTEMKGSRPPPGPGIFHFRLPRDGSEAGPGSLHW